MIKKILLAFDGSENAHRALAVAAELASKLEAKLHIVHVLLHGQPSEELVRMAEIEYHAEQTYKVIYPETTYIAGQYPELLSGTKDRTRHTRILAIIGEQLVERAKQRSAERGATNITTSIRNGDGAAEILSAAEMEDADMIVIGSRGLGVVRGTVLGSVSQKVLHHAPNCVVTVK